MASHLLVTLKAIPRQWVALYTATLQSVRSRMLTSVSPFFFTSRLMVSIYCWHSLFTYLGSIFDSNGGAERDINNRVKLAWMKWKQLTGVLCDKKVPIKLKDKVYKTVIKPTMTYGAECWAVRKKDENRLRGAEMRMLRWIRGKIRKDHVRNQIIQEDAKDQHS